MFAKKQIRQSNAKSRRNQHRKHHRKATCAEHVDATVSPPVLVPENHEKCHFLHPDGLILGPDRSTWLIFASKLALQGRSGLDRADQDRSRSLPGSILGRYGAPRVDPGPTEPEATQPSWCNSLIDFMNYILYIIYYILYFIFYRLYTIYYPLYIICYI